MPSMDKTGPQGQGPRTGRQQGTCKGVKILTQGLGMRRGMGQGRRFRNRWTFIGGLLANK